MSWPTVSLGTRVSKLGSGVTPLGGDSVYVAEGTALIRSQNVYNNRFLSDGIAYISDAQADVMKSVSVCKGDVLLNITGDSVARCCKVPIDILPARVNQHVMIIRPREEAFDSDYLAYQLTGPFFQSTLLSIAGSGGTRKALTKAMIARLEIPKPEISEQKRIVAILSAYDDLIENNRRRIALLEESARQLYKEWFVRFRFPGHEHVKVIDGVPEGWAQVQLCDFLDVIKDAANPKLLEPNTPYIGLEHIPRRAITLADWETAEKVESGKFFYQENDIIFGKIRPYFHKVGFALTSGITSSDAVVMRPKAKANWAIALMEISSDRFIALASQTVKEGSKMPRANWDVLKRHGVLLPPKWLEQNFGAQIEAIASQTKSLSFAIAQATKARDLLLPKLMSGALAV